MFAGATTSHPWASPPSRMPLFMAVLAGHGLLAWVVLQATPLRQVVAEALPVVVRLVSAPPPAPAPAPLPLPAPPAARAPVLPFVPPPEVVPPVAAAPAPPPPEPVPAPRPAAPVPQPPAPVVAAAPPAPLPVAPPVPAPAPKVLSGSAVRYRTPPPLEVPLASRRLGEAGTVVLRVLVGTDGAPRRVTVHRSSGFARLDEAAMAAMAQARFQPLVEDGQALECIVIAPLAFELD